MTTSSSSPSRHTQKSPSVQGAVRVPAKASVVHKKPVRPAPSRASSGAPSRSHGRYIESVGRRKEAVVRVRVSVAKGPVEINGKSLVSYFPLARQRFVALAPLAAVSIAPEELTITARATGGGLTAQAEAFSLGLARALVREDGARRGRLKSLNLLTRDARRVERKKFGSRKARRPQQWRKR